MSRIDQDPELICGGARVAAVGRSALTGDRIVAGDGVVENAAGGGHSGRVRRADGPSRILLVQLIQYEVRVALPPDLPNDPRTQLLITQNGNVSNRITVPVQSAIQ